MKNRSSVWPTFHDSMGFAVGVFFVLAGLAKQFVIWHDLEVFEYVRLSPLIQNFFLGIFEVFLGVFVVSRSNSRFTWIVLSLFLSCLLIVSAYRYHVGEDECGCLGVVRTSQLGILTIDSILLGISISCCLFFTPKTTCNQVPGTLNSLILAFAISLVAGCIFIGLYSYPRLRGNVLDELVTLKSALNVATTENSAFSAMLPVFNTTTKPITIVGINKPCKTRCDIKLPFEIRAGEVSYLPVRTTFSEDSKMGKISLEFYSDSDSGFLFPLTWRVRHNQRSF